jgi:hypothetical protein
MTEKAFSQQKMLAIQKLLSFILVFLTTLFLQILIDSASALPPSSKSNYIASTHLGDAALHKFPKTTMAASTNRNVLKLDAAWKNELVVRLWVGTPGIHSLFNVNYIS